MFDFRLTIGAKLHGDDIEAELGVVPFDVVEVKLRNLPHLTLLAKVYRFFGGAERTGRSSRSYFDEDEGAVALGDDVDLAAAAAPITGYEAVSVALQKGGGSVFADPSGLLPAVRRFAALAGLFCHWGDLSSFMRRSER